MIKLEYGLVDGRNPSYTIKTEKETVRFPHTLEGTGMFINYLNNLFKKLEEKPIDLHTNFEEWNTRLDWLDKTSRRLVEIDEEYNRKSDEILAHAKEMKEENGVDVIKDKYGGNNDKTRKKYVDEQLSDLINEKQELEFLKSNDYRRVELLKRLIDMKVELIRYSGGDEKV